MFAEQFGDHIFSNAASAWLDSRRNKIGTRTVKDYEGYIGSLLGFFGAMRLRDIHIGHVNNYQKLRQEEIRRSKQHRYAKAGRPPNNTDGANRINHEIMTLGQIMHRGGLWEAIKKFYEPLPLSQHSPGMALEPEEEEHLFAVARSNPRWIVAYCADLLSNATTLRPCEVQRIKLGDVLHAERAIRVHGEVKNKDSVRVVPCNDDAWWAVQTLLERAHGLGAHLAEHYLLPHRANKLGERPDPTRHMGSWKKAHYAIRREAAKKYPRLARLRRNDFRHSATTRLLENPNVSERTIEEMLGHRIGSKTKEIYSHIRLEARRSAAAVLNGGHAKKPVASGAKKPAARAESATIAAAMGD